jgi:nucleoside-diphosphate-sugar epimerase
MKSVAILGATGYIGASLSRELAVQKEAINLYLFSRSKEKILALKESVKELGSQDNNYFYSMEMFSRYNYDVVINCTGVSDLTMLSEQPENIIDITESVDTTVIDYLKNNPNTLYINMSSGIVHNALGTGSATLTPADYYAFAKKEAEKRHRSLSTFSIVDIRIFSFFSRYVNLKSHFLMSEVVECITTKKIFETNSDDIVRDYISPNDLCALILLIIEKGKVNDAYDAYSKSPVTKFKLLDFLKEKYGLAYSIKDGDMVKKGLSKNEYIPKDKKADTLGYVPVLSSLECIDHEMRALLRV